MSTRRRSISEEKAALRKQTRLKRKQLTPAENAASDQAILERILGLPEYRSAATVFCFVSTPYEIDTLPLLQHALEQGKRLAVPLCVSDGIMEVREIRSLDDLAEGSFGILEPTADCPLVPAEEIDFGVIPCVCCDRQCRRLGKGGGYYDRYLAGRRFPAAAVCRESLLCEAVPTEPTDIPVDMVVTDQRIYRNQPESCPNGKRGMEVCGKH